MITVEKRDQGRFHGVDCNLSIRVVHSIERTTLVPKSRIQDLDLSTSVSIDTGHVEVDGPKFCRQSENHHRANSEVKNS